MESNLTPSSSHKQLEARPLLHGSMFLKKDIQMEGKLLFVCIVKRLQKVEVLLNEATSC